MREPAFWWRPQGGTRAALLAPLAAVYGAAAEFRLAQTGNRAGVPVVCIGNPTVGGAGKTPLALALAPMLAAAGERPVFLTRGYGGRSAGPLRVDAARHPAAEVGDEPILLARLAPTVVAHDRVKGAAAALALGASVIVMDDGFQNPSLAKDFSVLVVDGRRGLGNGRVLPAGPLRAPLGPQLARADVLVVIGAGNGAGAVVAQARERSIPVFRGCLAPDEDSIAAHRARPTLAFAGIGDPEKFFATLRETGITVAIARSFPDHHRFTAREAQELCAEADRNGLLLVTTEKDLARLQGDEAVAGLAARALALPVKLRIENEAAFKALLAERVASARVGHGTTAERQLEVR